MLVAKKINLLRYLLLSGGLLSGLLCLSSWKMRYVGAMVLCFLGVTVGLLLLVQGVVGGGNLGGGRSLKLFLGVALKMLMVAGALVGSIQMMDNLVIFPLALYMGQIAILFICWKRA